MEGEIKVRAVDFEEKSVAEVEEQLLKQHEESTGVVTEPLETVETIVTNPETVETIITETNESTPVDEIDDSKVIFHSLHNLLQTESNL